MKYINLDNYGRREDPFYFALESHLLNLTGDFSFIWDVYPAVIIGKHQLSQNEVNFDYLKANDIKLFRRPSGGGAVYSDPGCIKYTFIARDKSKDEMYEKYLKVIQSFLKTLGLEARFSGRNDLVINGFKFSGNAYYQTNKGAVLHGTILFDTDLDKMSKVLTPSTNKLKSKGVKSVQSRVINLSELLDISRDEFISLFKKFLNHNEIYLTKEDEKVVYQLEKELRSDNYIFKKDPKYQITRQKRFDWGEIILNYEVKNDIISKIKIYGDFFEKEDIETLENHLKNQNIKKLELKLIASDYIDKMTNQELLKLIKGWK